MLVSGYAILSVYRDIAIQYDTLLLFGKYMHTCDMYL